MTTEATGPAETPEPAKPHEMTINRDIHREFVLAEALSTQTYLRAQALRLAQMVADQSAEIEEAKAAVREAQGISQFLRAILEKHGIDPDEEVSDE